MQWIRRLLLLAVIVAVLVGGWRFAAQNADTVHISYLFGEIADVALWLVLVVAFSAGAVVAGVAGAIQNARLRLVARRYRKTVKGLESEVHELRNLPLASNESAPDPQHPAEQGEDLPSGLLEGGA